MTRAAAVAKIESGIKTAVYGHAKKAANEVRNRNHSIHDYPRNNDYWVVSVFAITKP